jgi:ABC-2 type transport system permease protein
MTTTTPPPHSSQIDVRSAFARAATAPRGSVAVAASAPTTTRPPQRSGRSTAAETFRLGLRRGRLELKSFFRSKEAVVFTFAFPILLLMLFGSIFGGTVEGTDVSYKQVLVAGVMAAGIMSVSFSSLAISIAIERDDGTIKRLAGTPMPKAAYFIGKVVLAFVSAVAETALLLAIGVVLFGLKLPSDPGRWAVFTGVFVLGVVSCSLIGIAYGTIPRTAKSAPAIVNPPFVVLQFISGVWVLESQLPEGLRLLSALFPLKWMAQGFRSVFLPDAFAVVEPAGSWQTPLTFVVLAGWCVGGFLLCLLTFRWKTKD